MARFAFYVKINKSVQYDFGEKLHFFRFFYDFSCNNEDADSKFSYITHTYVF